MPDKPYLTRLAAALRTGELSFAEQAAVFAAIETIISHWNPALENDVTYKYGTLVRDVFLKEIKST